MRRLHDEGTQLQSIQEHVKRGKALLSQSMPRTYDIDSLKSAQYFAEKTDIFDILLRRVLSF